MTQDSAWPAMQPAYSLLSERGLDGFRLDVGEVADADGLHW